MIVNGFHQQVYWFNSICSTVWLSTLASRNIYGASKVVKIPIIGVGGVSCGKDAAEMLMAGATAVQVCTEAILKGPGIYGKIAKELNDFLDSHGYKDVNEIIGFAHKKSAERNFRTKAISPKVNLYKCIKCGQCKVSCVYDAIEIKDKLQIDTDKCFGCGLCVTKCPKQALTIQYNWVILFVKVNRKSTDITFQELIWFHQEFISLAPEKLLKPPIALSGKSAS